MSNRRGPPQPYSLYGVLVHSGHSVHSGHYFAFVKAPNGLWHQLDDNHVSQVSKGMFDPLVTTNWMLRRGFNVMQMVMLRPDLCTLRCTSLQAHAACVHAFAWMAGSSW